MRSWLVPLAAGVVLALGVVSASSLGTFSNVALSGFSHRTTPCTTDGATLLDGALDLVTGTVLPTSEISEVELANVAGDCSGSEPVVVVYGIDLTDPLAGEQRLLVLDGFGPLTTSGDVTLSLTSPVPLGDGLTLVLYDLTEARVAFCPGGATCT